MRLLDEGKNIFLEIGAGIHIGLVEEWREATGVADMIVCLDSFEHFEKPDEILRVMHRMLKPGGHVSVAFGPPWFHPYGGHLFSVFPYAHLLFSEHALVTWRGTLPGKEPKTSFLDAGLNKIDVLSPVQGTSDYDFETGK